MAKGQTKVRSPRKKTERRTESDDLLAGSGVETTRRLVENEDARFSDDRAGDGDTAFLASRDAALERRADAVVGDRGESERLQRRVDVVGDVGVRGAEAVGGQGQVSLMKIETKRTGRTHAKCAANVTVSLTVKTPNNASSCSTNENSSRVEKSVELLTVTRPWLRPDGVR